LSSVKTFVTSIISYLTSPTFIANMVGTVIVIALAIILYRRPPNTAHPHMAQT
jgi:hypothetical protein